MKYILRDYGINLDHAIIYDNTSVISLSKNLIQHSRTKCIEKRYNFLREHVQKGDIVLKFLSIEKQLEDIFISKIRHKLKMMTFSHQHVSI